MTARFRCADRAKPGARDSLDLRLPMMLRAVPATLAERERCRCGGEMVLVSEVVW